MQVIKTVKELTGASLMEAKKLVETPNAKLKEQAPRLTLRTSEEAGRGRR